MLARSFLVGLAISTVALSCIAGCTNIHQSALSQAGLVSVYQVDRPCNGITFDGSGRAFIAYPPPEGDGVAVRLATIDRDNKTTPYPDVSWNDWTPEKGAKAKFVFANSLRVVDGILWIIDVGAPGMGKPPVPGGPKLVAIDCQTNKVVRIIPLDSVVNEKSFVDDARFGARHAYVTDAGWPGLIVVDLLSGNARRVLNDNPAATDLRSMFADHKKMLKKDGNEVRVHADQLELSPNGKTLYFQPASGPMAKIETQYLEDASLSDAQIAAHVEKFYATPTTGGTAIDSNGNVYVDDCDDQQVIQISPNGTRTTVVHDSRLEWGDAMWIDQDGFLWIPAAQLNRTPGMNHGVDAVQTPVQIFKIQIHAKPVSN